MAISYDVVRAMIAATKDPESAEVRIAALAELGKVWMHLPADFSPEPAAANPPEPEGPTFEGRVCNWWRGQPGQAHVRITAFTGDHPARDNSHLGANVRLIILPETKGA